MLARTAIWLLLSASVGVAQASSPDALFDGGRGVASPFPPTHSFAVARRQSRPPNVAPLPPSSVTEASFNATLDSLNRTINPIVKARYGKAYLATGDWRKEFSEDSPGGSFYFPEQPGVSWNDSWGVHIVGWLARSPGFTDDSIAFVLCHELGHHVFSAEAESEADHFAPTCLRWAWGEPADARDFLKRVLAAYRPAVEVRRAAWLRMGFTPAEVENMLDCRQRVIVQGVAAAPMEQCAH